MVFGVGVVNKFNYCFGDCIVLFYGGGCISFFNYDDIFFEVIGIFEVIGMFVDQVVYISLFGMEVIYVGWEVGVVIFGWILMVEEVE